jgi:hypothetical protein
VRRGVQQVHVLVEDDKGEQWSCVPFAPPAGDWQGTRDGGDLVLQPDSTTVYCRGQIVDRAGKPVSTSVLLGDGHAVLARTTSDGDGRFQLCVGPWFTGPMTLVVPDHQRLITGPIERGDHSVRIEVGAPGPSQPRLSGQLLGIGPDVRLEVVVEAREAGSKNLRASSSLRPGGAFDLSLRPGRYDVVVRLDSGDVLLEALGIELHANEIVAPAALRKPLPASHRFCELRLVDREGMPCPVAPQTRDARATWHEIVPAAGRTLIFPEILQRIDVRGDRNIVIDPVLADVEVTALPAESGWFFGLAIGVPGAENSSQIGQLVDGRGRMFVPRDVPLVAHLYAMRYDAEGRPVPLVFYGRPSLTGFAGDFRLPADGPVECVRFKAPADLAEQLAAITAPARPR